MPVYFKGSKVSPVIKVQPKLVSKSITENGTYSAGDDSADGYSEVNVNVPPTLFRQIVDKTITTVTAEDLAGVTSIGRYAFHSCSRLTSVNIPDGVTSIGDFAFYECSRLPSIEIPNSVKGIGGSAFQNCSSLTSISIKAITPPTLSSANAFSYTNNCPIYVPTPNDYKVATNWSSLSSRIFPLVSTVADLANIDTTTYTKACVIGNEEYTEYTYDGSQWNEIIT